MRRVVITGVGAITCIGNGLDEIADSLRNGRSGIELIPERVELGFRSAIGGRPKNFQPPDVPKRNLRQMSLPSQYAVQASIEAIADAELPEELVRDERTASIVGCCGNFHDTYKQSHEFKDLGKKLGGTALQKVMADSPSANVTVYLKNRGICFTVSAACATGALAVGHASQLIRWGLQDRAICGGVQEDTWEAFCHFDALRAFSTCQDEPEKASKPFDKNRDGLAPSSGGSMFILEEYEAARARGAKIYGEIVGYAFASDGHDMTVPSGEGSQRSMRLALEDAGITADDVDYINAHATSTPMGDKFEAKGIRNVFGDRPYVSSTKSMTGHEVGAAGSNELVYTLAMMQGGFIAPNINLHEIDPECEGINIVANDAIEHPVEIAASNSFGFGGVNTCVIVKKI